MITKEDISKKLERLLGEQVDVYKVVNVVRDFFAVQIGFEVGRTYSWACNRKTIWFRWRGYCALEVSFRKRVKSRLGSHLEYVFVSFDVNLQYADSLEESIADIEEKRKNLIKEEASSNEQSVELLRYARSQFKLDDTALRALVLHLDRHFYNLVDMLDDEDLTADEIAYKRYANFEYSYQDYLDVCAQEEVEPRPECH